MATAAERKAAKEEAEQELIRTDLVADPMEIVRPFLAAAGQEENEVTFYIYRVVDGGKGTDAFMFKCRADDYDMEKIGKEYGSGVYRMKVYVRDEEHPNGVIRAAPKFAVEMPPGYQPKPIEMLKPQEFPALDMRAVSDMMDAKLERILLRLVPPAPPVDPFALMERVTGMVKAMMPAQAAPVAAPSFVDELGKVRAIVELGKLLNPNAGKPLDADGKTDFGALLLEKGADIISGLASAAAAQQGRTVLPAPEPAQPAAPALAVESPEPAEEDDMFEKQMFQYALKKACESAASGKSAEDFAEKWYEDMEDSHLSQLRDNPAWFAELVELCPDCGLHEAWFAELRGFFLAWWEEDIATDMGPPVTVDKIEEPAHPPAHGDIDPPGGTANDGTTG